MTSDSPLLKIGAESFNRWCLYFSALVLLVVFPGLLWFAPGRMPVDTAPNSGHVDFVQYYVGAQVVRHGLWDDLYPIPRQSVYGHPPVFQPAFRTFLFDPANAQSRREFYPPLNLHEASDCSPAVIERVPQAKDHFRYIYPPPTALLFWPLSWFDFDDAANRVWPTLSYVALFLTILFSSRIFQLLQTSASYGEGWVILASLFLVYRGPTGIIDGNITPILSALIAGAAWALMTRRPLGFSCALIPLVLVKTIGLMWLPLLLIDRVGRKAILYLGILSLLLNGIVLAGAGLAIYRTFFALLPWIGIPAGQGLVPTLVQELGFYPRYLYLLINVGVLVAFYYGYWVKRREALEESPLLPLVALLAGTMALFCLTNFTIWWHYPPNYLVLPFLGYLFHEGRLASGLWRLFVTGGTAICVLVYGSSWIMEDIISLLSAPHYLDDYRAVTHRPFMVLIPIFFLIVTARRLLSKTAASS